MITDNIKALFQFIEYLHSNIENFNQYNDLIKRLRLLIEERWELRPNSNYKDKRRLNELWAEYEPKFNDLQKDLFNPIKAKAIELNLGNLDGNSFFFTNEIVNDIVQLTNNFQDEDLPEIFKYRSQYLEYSTNAKPTLRFLGSFFDELDTITEYLFDFFKEPADPNEFGSYATKEAQKSYWNEVSNIVQRMEKLVDNVPSFQQQNNIEPSQTQPNANQSPELPETLVQLFEYPSKYKAVMEIFVDKQFIHAQTYIWKDEKANNKSLMCALLKDLEGKGYYKQEIKMNWNLCKAICKNTFHVTIGSNKTYYNADLDNKMKDLIPFATTIE